MIGLQEDKAKQAAAKQVSDMTSSLEQVQSQVANLTRDKQQLAVQSQQQQKPPASDSSAVQVT